MEMSPPSLSSLARKACERNLHMITDLGDAPYEIVKPLLKLMDPAQLHGLEQTSPQLIGRDAEIWKIFIKRDIMRSDKLKIAPNNPREWYSIYRSLLDAQEQRLADADAALRKLGHEAQVEKNKHATQMIEIASVKPLPGSTVSNQVLRMTKSERRHLREPVRGRLGQAEYRSKGTGKQPVETPAKQVSKISKLRKAAAQMSKVFNTGTQRMSTSAASRQIPQAPASFVAQNLTSERFGAQAARPSESRKRRIDEVEAHDVDDFVAQRKQMKAANRKSVSPQVQSIRSVADIGSLQTASPGDRKGSRSLTPPSPIDIARSPSPPSSTVKPIPKGLHQEGLQASAGPSPGVIRRKKAPVSIFMAPKRKRVT